MEPVYARGQAAAALGVLEKVIASVGLGRPADKTLAEIFRSERKFGSRDRRFITSLVFSFFRWRGWLDGVELPRAAALAYGLDASEAHNAQTALGGELVPAWGPLSLTDKMSALSQMLGRKLSMEQLVPGWLFNQLPAASDTPRLISSFQQRPPTWVRARLGRERDVVDALQKHSANPRRDTRMPSAISCDSGTNFVQIRKEIGTLFEVQDFASQAVGHASGVEKGQRWLDACAGAGGKSLHLADLMGDDGEVVASDVRDSALRELERRASAAGFSSIKVAKTPTGTFDGALVDAPCSGIGTWSRNSDMRWRTDSHVAADKSEVQLDVLTKSSDLVKSGGILVYAVCTITAAETGDVVAQFLARRNDYSPADFTTFDGLKSSTQTIWPWEGPGDGMFIAKFRRTC